MRWAELRLSLGLARRKRGYCNDCRCANGIEQPRQRNRMSGDAIFIYSFLFVFLDFIEKAIGLHHRLG